jgi:hypothetical protein
MMKSACQVNYIHAIDLSIRRREVGLIQFFESPQISEA